MGIPNDTTELSPVFLSWWLCQRRWGNTFWAYWNYLQTFCNACIYFDRLPLYAFLYDRFPLSSCLHFILTLKSIAYIDGHIQINYECVQFFVNKDFDLWRVSYPLKHCIFTHRLLMAFNPVSFMVCSRHWRHYQPWHFVEKPSCHSNTSLHRPLEQFNVEDISPEINRTKMSCELFFLAACIFGWIEKVGASLSLWIPTLCLVCT